MAFIFFTVFLTNVIVYKKKPVGDKYKCVVTSHWLVVTQSPNASLQIISPLKPDTLQSISKVWMSWLNTGPMDTVQPNHIQHAQVLDTSRPPLQ